MTFLEKLKHEWKTAAVAVGGTVLELYDQVLAAWLGTVNLVKPEYQWMVHVGVPMLMLLLRRWKDAVGNVADKSDTGPQ